MRTIVTLFINHANYINTRQEVAHNILRKNKVIIKRKTAQKKRRGKKAQTGKSNQTRNVTIMNHEYPYFLSHFSNHELLPLL